ncbi:hypothetical protein DSLASN_02840 [Desulfoluna limicola]|uniref:Tetratricopeptide repeat protein n=1 Tax=Desulfoluna limicola TaxID=2810562 RepID=A0ABM7PC65_9BACT|nr:hypothetical protein [Desulfoluna limicola]BCS94652.1 hypothetical protein DSLASN_02840 [Desulfoluna limicola]
MNVRIKKSSALLVILFTGTILFQHVYVQDKYGPLVLNEECPWCEEDGRGDEITYVPFNANDIRLIAPADPEFISVLLWMRTAYYFGLNSLKSGDYSYMLSLLDLVTDLSPKWEIPYLYGAILLPAEVGDIEGGLYMIDKGISRLPDSWQLWFLKGYYYWKSYGDNQAASEAIHNASKIKGAPMYFKQLSITLLKGDVNRAMEESYKKQVFDTITDPSYKVIFENDGMAND